MIKSRSILEDFSNSKEFNEVIKSSLTLPAEAVVISSKTGSIEETVNKIPIPYASFQCAELDEYELYKSINREEKTPAFTVKIKGYDGRGLQSFIGHKISLTSADIDFKMNKYNQPKPVGLVLVLDINNLKKEQ